MYLVANIAPFPLLDYFVVLQFNGGISSRRVSSEPRNLPNVLKKAIGLKPCEFDVPPELEQLEIPGDWVVRKGATPTQTLRALESILSNEERLSLRFTKGSMERDVIVVRGRWQPPADSTIFRESIAYLDPSAVPGGHYYPGTFASVQELFEDLSNIVPYAVVNETAEPGKLDLQWRQNLEYDADIRSRTPAGTEKLKAALRNLAKQTGLKIELERRPVPVWQVAKGK